MKSNIEEGLFDFFLEFSLYFFHENQISDDISLRFFFVFSLICNEKTIDMRSEKIDTSVYDESSENYEGYYEIIHTKYIRKCVKIFRIVLECIGSGKHRSDLKYKKYMIIKDF